MRDLRYGENPHQPRRLVSRRTIDGFGGAVVHQGKELSFTNLLDLDAAARIALEFDEPAAVVIKHTNPCGVATGESTAAAFVRARDADPLSAFGGIVGLNRPIDVATAQALTSTFIEAVIAPGIDERRRAAGAGREAEYARRDRGVRHGVAGRDVRSILGGVARAGAGSRGRSARAVAGSPRARAS